MLSLLCASLLVAVSAQQLDAITAHRYHVKRDGRHLSLGHRPRRHFSLPEWHSHVKSLHRAVAATRYGPATAPALKPDDFFAFSPDLFGGLKPGQSIIVQAGQYPDLCFRRYNFTLTLTSPSSILLNIDAIDKVSLLCTDLFLFAAIDVFHVHDQIIPQQHVIDISNLPPETVLDIRTNGIRILHFRDAVLQDVVDVYETILLFLRGLVPIGPPGVPEETANMNREFLQDHMGLSMPPRRVDSIGYNESNVDSGDFLGIIRLDGLDPMIAWGEGAHTGHTVVVLEVDGVKYVVESQSQSHYWPVPLIQRTPFAEWLTRAQAASYNVVHLPLLPQYKRLFNHAAAVEFFKSVESTPYGFNNFLWGWIDSPDGNYPPPLRAQTVMILGSILEAVDASVADMFVAQALNHRLGTKGLNVSQVYTEANKRGILFGDLMAMPEQDAWWYTQPESPGWKNVTQPIQSMVCDVFVCRILKAAGLFGATTPQINCGEFTNWDVYSLEFYDPAPPLNPACTAADPGATHCQILGKYKMTLNNVGQRKVFPHMRENCVGISPNYYWDNATC